MSKKKRKTLPPKDSLQLLLEEALTQPRQKPNPWLQGKTIRLICSETEESIGVFQEWIHRSSRARRLTRIPDANAPAVADRIEFLKGDWWKPSQENRPYSPQECEDLKRRFTDLLSIVSESTSGS